LKLIVDIETTFAVPLNEKTGDRDVRHRTTKWKNNMHAFGMECLLDMRARGVFGYSDSHGYKVHITQRPTLDIDALDKFILDGMQKVVYKNDKQIDFRSTSREPGRLTTRVQVWQIEP